MVTTNPLNIALQSAIGSRRLPATWNWIFVALTLSILTPISASSATLSNVRVSQRAATQIVDVDYDLENPENTRLTIVLSVYDEAGAIDSVPARTFAGDIGTGVAAGKGKRITWYAGLDWPNKVSTSIRFQVAARELTPSAAPPPNMVLIPGGSFLMGDSFLNSRPADGPVHSVALSPFYLDKTEITKSLWDEVKEWSATQGYGFDNPGGGKASNHPVQSINWFDAVKWCNARSQKEGRTPAYYSDAARTQIYKTGRTNPFVRWDTGFRLPTEAEWEYAARGGDHGHRFPWSDSETISHGRANYNSLSDYTFDVSQTRGYHPAYSLDGPPYTSPSGSFAANGFGLYDMAGNVWEWCWDWYGSYSGEVQLDPHGPGTGLDRVIRGGGWRNNAEACQVANRSNGTISLGNNYGGFRNAIPPRQFIAESGLAMVDTRIPPAPGNSPTMDTIPDLTLNENAPVTTVSLSGIGPGTATTLRTLSITAVSDNVALIPNPQVSYTSPGREGTIRLQPTANASGTATIIVTLSVTQVLGSTTSQVDTLTRRFLVRVLHSNRPPSITIKPTLSTLEDTPLTGLPITVADLETSPERLLVEAISSNQILLPNTGISLAGSGANRTLSLFPATNQNGAVTIAITVRDGDGASTTNLVSLEIVPVDDAPILAPLNDASIIQNSVSLPIPILIQDIDTPGAQLHVTASSSDTTLVPDAGLTFTAVAGGVALQIRPAQGRSGRATIQVTVRDEHSSSQQGFNVVVTALDSPPSIVLQPQGRTVLAGTTVTFNVQATGTEPFQYQWMLNGTNLPSATNAALVLPNVTQASSGRYSLRLTNHAGSTNSDEAILLVGLLGSKLWEFATEGQIRSSVCQGPDGTLYVGSDDGRIYALNRLGQRQWSFATGGPVISSPAIWNGVVYAGSQDGKLYAILKTGDLKWSFETGGAINSSPAVGTDGTIYVGSDDNRLYALSPDGTKSWDFTTGGLVYSSPGFGNTGTNILFGSYDNRFYSVTASGLPAWSFITGGVLASSPAIGLDGTSYFGSADKRLYAIQADGSKLWSYLAAASITGSPVINQDGSVHVGTEDGKLISISAEGKRRWEFSSGGPIYGAPAIGGDGTIYFGSFDSKLYALNPNGTKRWEFATGGPLYASPCLDQEGVLYIGSYDGKIYAIRGGAGLSDSPWPMFHQDVSHLGTSNSITTPALALSLFQINAGGQPGFNISGPRSSLVDVESSQDLVQWLKTGEAQLDTTGKGRFFDSKQPSAQSRFFRAKQR